VKHSIIQSEGITFSDNLYLFFNPQRLCLGHYRPERFEPPIRWSVSKDGEIELTWEESNGVIAVGRFKDSLKIVKSDSYGDSYSNGFKLYPPHFINDGEIILTWAANRTLYTAR
jgi:hypothetical protein